VTAGPQTTAGAPLVIRAARATDEVAWRRQWALYIAAENSNVPEAVTASTWQRILDPDSPVGCLIAERDGAMAGFAVTILHPGTWSLAQFCYLEDLYVDDRMRGQGIGKALIDNILDLAKQHGWSRVYWNTREGNATARRLYDRFGPADGFVRYRIDL
jgi:GNAT superfamily N-acetyltransferase